MITSSASLAPVSTTAVGWILANRSALLLVEPRRHLVGDVERFARVDEPRRLPVHDHREALLLADRLHDLAELGDERGLEAALVDLELALELLELALDLV